MENSQIKFEALPAGHGCNILHDVLLFADGAWSKVGQMFCSVELYSQDGGQEFMVTGYHARVNGLQFFQDVRCGSRFGNWTKLQTEEQALQAMKMEMTEALVRGAA